MTAHPNGTVTLAVYKDSGIAGANAKLRQLGDGQVVVVPVGTQLPEPVLAASAARSAERSHDHRGKQLKLRLFHG